MLLSLIKCIPLSCWHSLWTFCYANFKANFYSENNKCTLENELASFQHYLCLRALSGVCYPSQQPLPFPISIIRELPEKKMLCFFLSTVDHIRLYFILQSKASHFMPQAAWLHVFVWSLHFADIPNVAISSSSCTSRRSPTLLVLLQFYTMEHFRGCILTSLSERKGHCCYRWIKISPQD